MTDDELRQLIASNARAIQALGDQISELTHNINELTEAGRQAQAEREELRQATIGIANLLTSLDSDRPTILRKLNTIEHKVDQLLERQDNGTTE
ncbi:MAG: hypothetical protein NW224_23485 [Leptolyngbyaceae cyanobacterium bins.302]|nr:hypothetical protein [Leptolyngbyaceae cyanobacterium bins.302]